MKHWNRSKKYREQSWTSVKVGFKHTDPMNPAFLGTIGWDNIRWNSNFLREAKKWCQDNPSTGRFFIQPYSNTWWFEFGEDAIIFKLKWLGQIDHSK